MQSFYIFTRIYNLKSNFMKTGKIYFGLLAVVAAFMFTSCGSPVTLTSWKNPDNKSQISNVVIMPMFEKLEYMKPFEQAVDAYFEKQGLKAIGSLDFLNPSVKYPLDVIKHRCDSLGADAILVFNYTGTDKTEDYIPQTTYVTGGYGGYWGGGYWGGGYYGGAGYYGGGVVSTGGYWTTTSVINLKASLYTHGSKEALWTGDITVTDPQYVDQAAASIAQFIYADWQKYGLLKFAAKK
jgi:hypothetical protein